MREFILSSARFVSQGGAKDLRFNCPANRTVGINSGSRLMSLLQSSISRAVIYSESVEGLSPYTSDSLTGAFCIYLSSYSKGPFSVAFLFNVTFLQNPHHRAPVGKRRLQQIQPDKDSEPQPIRVHVVRQ